MINTVIIEDKKRTSDHLVALIKEVEHEMTMKYLMQINGSQKRSRIIVRKGIENISLLLSDVVLFFTENKITYVIDKSGKKYMTDKNLTDLERELDNKTFFRASRQYIL